MRRLGLFVAAVAGFALAVVPALAEDQSVGTDGTSFTPSKVAVKPGEKVTISNTNGGPFPHDAEWADGAPGSGAASATPWNHDRTFTTAGEYVFYCSVHGSPDSGMRGTVYVNEAGTVPSGGGGGTTTTSTTPPPGGTTTTSTTPPPPPGGGGGGGGGGTTPSTTPTTVPAPGAPDTTPARVTRLRSTATRQGLVVRLTVSEPGTITLRVFRGARRVARRTYVVDGGAVTLRLRRALRRGRYALRLAIADDAGNRSTRSLSARVK